MHSNKLTFIFVLFMVVTASGKVRGAEQNPDGIRLQQFLAGGDSTRICQNLRDTVCDKERTQKQPLNQDTLQELSCLCELLEEIKKTEKVRVKNQDQQADILEKLLKESSVPGTTSRPVKPVKKLPTP